MNPCFLGDSLEFTLTSSRVSFSSCSSFSSRSNRSSVSRVSLSWTVHPPEECQSPPELHKQDPYHSHTSGDSGLGGDWGSHVLWGGDLGGRFVLTSKEMFVYHETATVKLFFSVWVVVFCLSFLTIKAVCLNNQRRWSR